MIRRILMWAMAAAFLLMILAVTGCGGSSPSATVEEFMKASNDHDCEKIVSLIDFTNLQQGGQTMDREQLIKDCEAVPAEANQMTSFKVLEERIDGDKAVVEVEITGKENDTEQTETVSMDLRQVDGEWLIFLDFS